MGSWGVWDVRPTSECLSRTGKKPIGGRWVDHNKGDAESPNVRSRYVAKDIAHYKDDSMFAATPPPGGTKTPPVRLGYPAPGPSLRPPARGPKGSPYRR
eukprot:10171997-Alexandrium_andersonii.AAC.3